MSPLSSLLLVDPDPGGLETMAVGFEREGCAVTGVSDLARAADMARTGAPQLAVVSLRGAGAGALDLVRSLRGNGNPGIPVVAFGPPDVKAAALAAGASDFIPTPLFVRDVVSVGKLVTGASLREEPRASDDEPVAELESRLSEYHGLFYLLRAVAATGRSGVLVMNRGNHKAQLRFWKGTVMTCEVGGVQGLPAVHHLLLWEEAELTFRFCAVAKRTQLHLSAEEIIDECERFLRDLAFSARDLGPPRAVYVAAAEFDPRAAGMQPSQVGPILRLFDGHRRLSDVIEESPFRVFDTLRVMKRLRDAGALTPQAGGGPDDGPRSFMEQWAALPDLRGVVGDRRRSRRKLKPITGSGPTPIPLTAKKPEAPARRPPHRTPPPVALVTPFAPVAPGIGEEATMQAKVDAAGLPVAAPLVPARPVPLTALERKPRTPTPIPLLPAEAKALLHEVTAPRLTPSTAFDAVEADFFAREADLYKGEKVETFDDLDAGVPPKK
jgi:CheY-like chemotaxis protein